MKREEGEGREEGERIKAGGEGGRGKGGEVIGR